MQQKKEPNGRTPDGLPAVPDRRQVHILNPAAGGGRHYEAARRAVESQGGEIMVSEVPGGIAELVRELFLRDPVAHAVVYGGDGTVYETVNGIMQSGANDTASFSVIPVGSGNDFSSYVNDSGVFEAAALTRIDAVRTESGGVTRWYANMMNIGFDCAVVWQTYRLKKNPLFRGSGAYIAGVAKELIKKKTIEVRLTAEGCVDPADGSALGERLFSQKILLTACANGQNCGGGFHALPYASVTDGLLDMLVVNDVSRARFVALVGDYRQGTYIDERGVLKEKFEKVLQFVRCRAMTIEGPERFCLDGEIFETGPDRKIRAEAVPGALWYAAAPAVP